jgi:Domain of unknown function (DUF4129)
VTVSRWFARAVAALAAAGSLVLASAQFPARAAVRERGPAGTERSSQHEAATDAQDGSPPSGRAGTDPALAAREVLEDQDFWWKRIEIKTIPTSGIQAFFMAVLEYPLKSIRMILDFLANLRFQPFRLFRGDWSWGSTVVWLIAAALLAWAIWKGYPLLVRWFAAGADASGTRKGAGASWQTLAEPSDLYQQAGEAFAEGKYAEAIRLALLSLIARLEKQGLLRYDTTRTNREYQAELRRRASDLAVSFGQLARIYERAWYGRVPAGRAEAEQAIGLCRSLFTREDLAPE